jgi:hypothetical protein
MCMDHELLWCYVTSGCSRNYYVTICQVWWGGFVTDACELLLRDWCFRACELLMFGGYGWPAGSNLPGRVWVWGNSPTHDCIWGYPWCHIVVTGIGLGSPYPMGIYPLPFWTGMQQVSSGPIPWAPWDASSSGLFDAGLDGQLIWQMPPTLHVSRRRVLLIAIRTASTANMARLRVPLLASRTTTRAPSQAHHASSQGPCIGL